MKKLLSILLVLPNILSAQQKEFVITGTVTGLADNAQVVLTDMNKPKDTVAKTIATKGSFVLKGLVKEANLYQLSFDTSAKKKKTLFIGNEVITIKGNVEDPEQLEVKGSAVNKDFTELEKIFYPPFQRLQAFVQQLYGKQPSDSQQAAYNKTFDSIVTSIDQFVQAKKASPVSAYLLLVTNGFDDDPAKLEERYNLLTPEVQKGFYGKILGERIANSKVGAVGTQAIEFTQSDTSGNPVSLNSFRGKYVLVDFWASWCRPCRMENPNVVAAYNKFKDKNFTVLSVSLDKSRDNWIKAIKDDGLVWTHVSDLQYWNNEVAQKYKIQSIPQNFLVDPTGKVVGKNLQGEDLEKKLAEVLK